MPADILLVLAYDEAQGQPTMAQKDLDAMLDWLDAGSRPRDQVVLNHMIYHLGEFTSGSDTKRLLRIFNALPQRNENWWILQLLQDPSALPILKYWSTLPAPKDQQEMLERTIAGLEARAGKSAKASAVCCEATEECLLEHIRNSPGAAAAPGAAIHSEGEAREWLNRGAEPTGEIKVRYTDELKRSAVVRRTDGSEERWQFIYDCWRNMQGPAVDAAR